MNASSDAQAYAQAVPATMKAARMHEVGGALKIEELPTPKPGSMDVLVRVRSCGIVPNLGNILANWTTWFPHMPLPPLPAIFGLDPAGEIAAVGDQVHSLKPGDRVYVNPGRSCGSCGTAAGAMGSPAGTMCSKAILASTKPRIRPMATMTPGGWAST